MRMKLGCETQFRPNIIEYYAITLLNLPIIVITLLNLHNSKYACMKIGCETVNLNHTSLKIISFTFA